MSLTEANTSNVEEVELSAEDLINCGKIALEKNEIPVALDNFQRACHIMSEDHGETSDEMVSVYIYYGTALLAMSRLESTVLGNALTGIEDGECDKTDTDFVVDDEKTEDWDKISKEVVDAMVEKDVEECEEVEKKEETTEDKEKSEEKSEDKTERDSHIASEDITHLQLAWEILEITRKILEKHEEPDMLDKLASVFVLLGEISTESGEYESAIEDFNKSLNIREKLVDDSCRKLSEIYYHIGLTYSYAREFTKSIENINKSMELIKKGIEKLSENPEDNEQSLVEMKMLLPEMTKKLKSVEEENEASCTNGKSNNGTTGVIKKREHDTIDEIEIKKSKIAIDAAGDAIPAQVQ